MDQIVMGTRPFGTRTDPALEIWHGRRIQRGLQTAIASLRAIIIATANVHEVQLVSNKAIQDNTKWLIRPVHIPAAGHMCVNHFTTPADNCRNGSQTIEMIA